MTAHDEESADVRDLRPLGLALVAWPSMWLAAAAEPWLWWLGVGGVVALGLAAAVRRSWFLAALAVLAAACLASGVVRVGVAAAGPLRALAVGQATAVVEVRLDGAGRSWAASGTRSELWVGSGTLVGLEGRGGRWVSGARVEVLAAGELAGAWSSVPLGATVRAAARLGEPDAGVPAEAVVRAREPPVVVAEPDAVQAAVGRVRQGLREACAGLPADARALVPALVVGDTSGVPDELSERFRTTGLTHLTAVSGANLVLLLGFLRAVAVAGGVRGRWLTGLLVAGVAGFVVLCLGEPSVVRAAAMGLVGLAALGRGGRGRQGLRYLAVAVVVVVAVDPWMARSIGFALSVLASFGLLWWAGRWADVLARWLPRWCAESVAVPLAAQVATEPVVVALSGQVSVVGVLANALAGPLVGPATVFGIAAAGLSVVWPAGAALVAWPAGWCAQAIAWVARLGDALPGAAVPWPATPVALALVVGGCALAIVIVPWLLARPWWCLGLAVALVVSLLRVPSVPGWPPRDWAVVFCDVGQGDATVLNAGAGRAVVVDTGPDPESLSRCLGQLGLGEVPLLVLTHLHADHAGGVAALSGGRAQRVLTSSVRSPAQGAGLVAAATVGVPHDDAEAGSVWQVGDVRLEVLASPVLAGELAQSEGESSAENDASLLLRATVGGLSVLLAGDAEDGAQAGHVALGDRLDADVLLVPHHGSSRQSAEFLAAARADLAVVSVGADNDYGHPTQRTLRAVAATGAQVVRTDERGSVAVARVDGRLTLTTQR